MPSRSGTTVIANGASLSSEIDLWDGDTILAIEISAAWTAAAITFVADLDNNGSFGPVYDSAGAELTIAAGSIVADRVILLNTDAFKSLTGKIKLRSGTSALPVNQLAERVLPISLGKRF